MAFSIQILAILGFFVSIYAFYVEKKIAKNQKYVPVCDISENVSCSRAFVSEYSKTLGIPNSAYGIVFYSIIFLLDFNNLNTYVFYLSIPAFLGSLYLAYISYFKVKTYCLVCNGIYIINLLLLVFSYLGL